MTVFYIFPCICVKSALIFVRVFVQLVIRVASQSTVVSTRTEDLDLFLTHQHVPWVISLLTWTKSVSTKLYISLCSIFYLDRLAKAENNWWSSLLYLLDNQFLVFLSFCRRCFAVQDGSFIDLDCIHSVHPLVPSFSICSCYHRASLREETKLGCHICLM